MSLQRRDRIYAANIAVRQQRAAERQQSGSSNSNLRGGPLKSEH
jgi:hypothetical protein